MVLTIIITTVQRVVVIYHNSFRDIPTQGFVCVCSLSGAVGRFSVAYYCNDLVICVDTLYSIFSKVSSEQPQTNKVPPLGGK